MTSAARLASLDAFRGFAIASMVLVNNPGSWEHIHPQLAHARWDGCTFTDLVFPFFLFAAGLSMTISLGRRLGEGGSRWRTYRTLARRAAVLFLIGVALNFISSFQPATVRIPGVLQRIALTLVLGAPVVLWGRWRAALSTIAILLGTWLALQFLVPVPGPDGVVAAGRLGPGLDFGSWLDRAVFGRHLWAQAKTWDPEGLIGTLPATASLLLGVLAGWHLQAPAGRIRKSLSLALAGALLLALGHGLGAVLPVNKNLWTPTFVAFTGGWSLLFLAGFRAALDEAPPALLGPARKACMPLTIYGMNALFLFVFSGLVARLLVALRPGGVPLKTRMYQAVAALPLSPENASLVFALGFNLAMFGIAVFMWRRRWFVKV